MRSFVAIVMCLGILEIMMGVQQSLATAQEPSALLNKPIWAKQATVLDLSCSPHPQSIASPNRQSSVEIVCSKHEGDDPTYSLSILTSGNHRYESPLEDGAHELLWAPNSNAFFVNGVKTAYSDFFVSLYRLEPSTGVRKETITDAAQRDMVNSFPPCKAYNRDEETCARIVKHPEYNMSGLAWTEDSSAINVIAEVPCGSSYGGIMCQVLGYVVNVSSGRILARLSAQQVKLRWGNYAAWDIRIPDPPKYGPAHVTW